MKKRLAGIVFSCACLIAITGFAQQIPKFESALQYMEFIGAEHQKIAKEQWDYMRVAGNNRGDKVVEKRRLDLLSAITLSRRLISRMPPYKGNSSYRDSLISYLRINEAIIGQDYAKIVNMEEVAEQSYDQMEAYLLAKELANERSAGAFERLADEQKRFALENKINLVQGEESRLDRRMREAGKVMRYRNEVYLILFKSLKQDIYAMEAAKAGDLNALEQNRNALLSYSKEGLEKLKGALGFKGDLSLVTVCREALLFYKDESERVIPTMTEYFTSKEKFERIKQSFDLIKPSDRKQEDVKSYNAAIDEYNTALQKYNEVNRKLYEQRSKIMDKWNDKYRQFSQKFMP